jgi:hypothetical protein
MRFFHLEAKAFLQNRDFELELVETLHERRTMGTRSGRGWSPSKWRKLIIENRHTSAAANALSSPSPQAGFIFGAATGLRL